MSNRPLPEDPMVRSLIKMAKKSQLSRRSFLAGAGGSAVALGLAACASDSELVAAEDISATDKTLNWSNWPFYIDEDDDGMMKKFHARQTKSKKKCRAGRGNYFLLNSFLMCYYFLLTSLLLY